MNRNYEIIEGIYLVQGSYKLDLHNNYDFKRLGYSVAERKLVLSWERSIRDSVGGDMPKSLAIEFNDVSEFRFMPRDSSVPFTEDDCVASVGYLVGEDWAAGIITVAPDQSAETHWLTAIEFMSGAVLAVQAGSANAKIET